MEKVFRARGIRILRGEHNIILKEKIYYEPDEVCIVSNVEIKDLLDKNIISLFEYSVVGNNIDTYNFHVNLNGAHQLVYSNIENKQLCELNKINTLLGDIFKNYTIGYKLENNQIIGRSFYYYPTIWKHNRYGIKGIIDRNVIEKTLERFYRQVIPINSYNKQEIEMFSSFIYKFKGVSVSYIDGGVNYKIYCRMEREKLQKLLKNSLDYNLDNENKYGPVVLVAQRIKNFNISGYNIYYLS